MANPEIVEKLRAIVKNPEAIARLKEGQKRARETIDFIREISQVDLNQLRRTVYTI